MRTLYELGKESYKSDTTISRDVLDTMDDEFRSGYIDARESNKGNGINEVTIKLSRIAPREDQDKQFTLSWSDLTLLVESHRYGKLGSHPNLQPMRTAIKFHLEKRHNQCEFETYTSVCDAMDVIYKKLMLLSELKNVGDRDGYVV